MTESEPPRYELWSTATEIVNGRRQHVFMRLRDATADEIRVAQKGRARDVLEWIGYGSMIGEISHSIHEFERVVSIQMAAGSDVQTPLFATVQHRFGSVLLAARAYAERNERWMRHQFGKKSDNFEMYKTACSFEYDHVNAYRLGNGLRNVVTHAGDAINISRIHAAVDDDQGLYRRRPHLASMGRPLWPSTART